MKKFLLALTTVAVVTGCNNDEVYLDEQVPKPETTVETPIAFSMYAVAMAPSEQIAPSVYASLYEFNNIILFQLKILPSIKIG